MYDILTLNDKKVAELKEVAQEFNIEKIDKFKKQEGKKTCVWCTTGSKR